MPFFPYRGVWPKVADDVFIAPGAMIIGDVTLLDGANIWFNAVIRGDSAPIIIGRNTNIQDNCTLHVDADAPLVIGDHCTIGHNAVVHGATLGEHVLIGMNAVILSHSQIDAFTVIGAHGLVGEGKHIPGGVLAVGTPARVIRTLSDEDRQRLGLSATHYVELAQEFDAALEQNNKNGGE